MQIAGGLYRELCCIPEWDATFGSGGRAALAVSALSPKSTLYTYAESSECKGVQFLYSSDINLMISPRRSGIVFSYFHPLSTPHIEPCPSELEKQDSLVVSGEAVLRFGFLEGDAVIHAKRAVYDPQTWKNPPLFQDNGSNADELAIVLNEHELLSLTGRDDISDAAISLIDEKKANVVIAKRGIRGATAFEQNGKVTKIPAYRSSKIFKIGTGDVFSAIFAVQWAERRKSVAEAANLASLTVAAYCDQRLLPVNEKLFKKYQPVPTNPPGTVLLLGKCNTVGSRYVMEEARFVLKELGVEVVCPNLGSTVDKEISATLILTEGLNKELKDYVELAKSFAEPIVLLNEVDANVRTDGIDRKKIIFKEDFTSAIYQTAWAAMG